MSVTKYLKEIGKPVAYYPRLARALESVGAAVFLCQLLYWDGKGDDSEGWIYKTQVEIEQETGLTRRKQETARNKLKEHGLLDEQRRGTHGTLHFKINLQELDAFWSEYISANGANLQTSMHKTANDECTKPPNANGANRHSLIKDSENTTETTTEKIDIDARVETVFSDYCETIKVVSRTQKRLSLIKNRLLEGKSEAQLHSVWLGALRDPWPERKLHNDITHLLETPERIERMIELSTMELPVRNGNGTSQQTARAYSGKPEVKRDFTKYPARTG